MRQTLGISIACLGLLLAPTAAAEQQLPGSKHKFKAPVRQQLLGSKHKAKAPAEPPPSVNGQSKTGKERIKSPARLRQPLGERRQIPGTPSAPGMGRHNDGLSGVGRLASPVASPFPKPNAPFGSSTGGRGMAAGRGRAESGGFTPEHSTPSPAPREGFEPFGRTPGGFAPGGGNNVGKGFAPDSRTGGTAGEQPLGGPSAVSSGAANTVPTPRPGASAGTRRSNQPTYDSESGVYVWGDGTKVSATAPDGSLGKVNEKGDILYRDGTLAVHGDDGSVTIHKPDGNSSSFEVDQPTYDSESGVYVWGDGAKVSATAPDGSLGEVNEKGDISYSDGTLAVHGDDGSVIVHEPDGNSSSFGVDQPIYDSESGVYVWGDGTKVSATAPDGSLGKVNEKGDILYRDGTLAVHGDDGSVIVHKPDGSRKTDTTNEDGSWSSDDSGDTSDDTGSSSGGDSDDSSGPSDTDGSSDGDSGSDDSDSGDSNDSDSSSDADTESDSGDSADENPDEGGSDKQDYGDGGYRDGPSASVQAILDRTSGKRREPESSQPEECEGGGFGGGVSQPGAGGQGNCVPAGTPGVEPGEQSIPDAGEAAIHVDRSNRSRSDERGRVTQPGFGDFGQPVDDLPGPSQLDRDPVTNPGEPR